MNEPLVMIPEHGRSRLDLLADMEAARTQDVRWQEGKAFSLVYSAEAEVNRLLQEVYTLFFSENGLNPAAFPSLRKFETETIAMCAGLLGGDRMTCGSLTSGGTESILMAVKSARDWSRIHRPEIKDPEILVPASAHPAFDKAAQILGLRIRRTPVRRDLRADVEAARSAITPNLIIVPFLSLTPDITPDYDERTTLTGYRMFFNLSASLATAVAAPMIVDSVVRSGGTQQQGYLLVAAIFGGLAAIPFLIIFLVVREPKRSSEVTRPAPLKTTLRTAWTNIPFRFVSVIYMLNWITFDLVRLMLPFYLTYWIAEGDMLATVPSLGGLALESAVFALLLVTAVLALPLWLWLSRRLSKRDADIIGMSFWAVVQMVIFMLQPGQVGMILFLSVLAGLSVSTAHVLPDAIFPYVLEWDELRTRRRQEGIYYGVKNLLRKITGAVAIFFALQMLSWSGYQTPPPGTTQFSQPDSTLIAIRLLTGPIGAALLVAAIVVTWFYPLSRERHARIRRLLEKRKLRLPE